MNAQTSHFPILSIWPVIISAIAILAPQFSSFMLFLEILQQYKMQVIGVAFLCFIFLLVRRRYILCLIQFGLILFGVWVVLSAYDIKPTAGTCEAPHKLRVMTMNVYHLNEDYAAIVNTVTRAEPDIVLFQEFKSGLYHAAHDIFKKKYPFHYSQLEQGTPQGKTVYSKYPIERAKFSQLNGVTQKVLHAEVSFQGQVIDFIGVHTVSPQSLQRVRARNTEMMLLTGLLNKLRQDTGRPMIIVGDFNSVPWQENVKKLKEETGLNNNSFYNILPSWPAWLPPLVRVPIDHIFYSKDFVKSHYYSGLEMGSDHLPIYADLEMCK